MKLKLLDTLTGETRIVDEPEMGPQIWCEGNWSCDHNRAIYFAEEGEEIDDNEDDGAHQCMTGPNYTFRYQVIEILDWHGEAPSWTLAEFNEG